MMNYDHLHPEFRFVMALSVVGFSVPIFVIVPPYNRTAPFSLPLLINAAE